MLNFPPYDNRKNSFVKSLDLDPDQDDFRKKLTVTSLSKDTSAVKISQNRVSGSYAKLPTDRQTDKCQIKHNPLGGGNNKHKENVKHFKVNNR